MATTTNYGWTTPDDTDLVKDGAAAIRTLGLAIDTSFVADEGDLLLGGSSDIFEPLAIGAANTVLTSDGTTASWVAPAGGGLTLVKSQTIGTTVASVTVTDAFSATYDSYQIIINGGAASASGNLNLQLGATTTGYYSARVVGIYSTAVAQVGTNNNGASWTLGGGNVGTIALNCFLQDPFLSKNTKVQAGFLVPDTASAAGGLGGFLDNTTSYTAFTIAPASGTLTGGTIRVYGYQNS